MSHQSITIPADNSSLAPPPSTTSSSSTLPPPLPPSSTSYSTRPPTITVQSSPLSTVPASSPRSRSRSPPFTLEISAGGGAIRNSRRPRTPQRPPRRPAAVAAQHAVAATIAAEDQPSPFVPSPEPARPASRLVNLKGRINAYFLDHTRSLIPDLLRIDYSLTPEVSQQWNNPRDIDYDRLDRVLPPLPAKFLGLSNLQLQTSKLKMLVESEAEYPDLAEHFRNQVLAIDEAFVPMFGLNGDYYTGCWKCGKFMAWKDYKSMVVAKIDGMCKQWGVYPNELELVQPDLMKKSIWSCPNCRDHRTMCRHPIYDLAEDKFVKLQTVRIVTTDTITLDSDEDTDKE